MLLIKTNKDFFIQGITHLTEKVITLGDLVSFSFKVTSLKEILETASLLIFREEQNYRKIKNDLLGIYKNYYMLTDPLPFEGESIFKYIEKTFKLRHIFCHEVAFLQQIDPDEIRRCYLASKMFLKLMNRFLFTVKFPASSDVGFLIQPDMNSDQYLLYRKQEKDLERIVVRICSNQNRRDRFLFKKKLLMPWKKNIDITARFLAREEYHPNLIGGSLWFTLYYFHLERLTRFLINELEDNFKIFCTFTEESSEI